MTISQTAHSESHAIQELSEEELSYLAHFDPLLCESLESDQRAVLKRLNDRQSAIQQEVNDTFHSTEEATASPETALAIRSLMETYVHSDPPTLILHDGRFHFHRTLYRCAAVTHERLGEVEAALDQLLLLHLSGQSRADDELDRALLLLRCNRRAEADTVARAVPLSRRTLGRRLYVLLRSQRSNDR